MQEERQQLPSPQPPPPLEANDQQVTAVFTACWAVALIVLLIMHGSVPHWWIWTAGTGTAMGVFGLWYVPRLKHGRARAAERREALETLPPHQEQGTNS